MKLRLLLFTVVMLPTLFIPNYNFAQSQTNESTIDDIVVSQLKVIYGDYYQTHIKDSPDIIKLYKEFYERCELISRDEAPSTIANISSLDLKDKYNPEKIKHDFMESFDEKKFIVLKYQFDFYNKTDKYYLIYNTNTVLKINKSNL